MSATSATLQDEAAKSVVNFIVQRMKTGASNTAIAAGLVAMGMDAGESSRVVDAVSTEVIRVARQQRPTGSAVLAGLIGGALAALIGGVAWGLIVARTDFEIGFMAWGLGLLAGFGVVLFARGKKGVALQTVAVATSVAGIGLGKYVLFTEILRRVVLERVGAEAAARVTVLSAKVLGVFLQSLSQILTPYDGLWVVLAVLTAWRIPKGLGIKTPPQMIGE